MYILNDILNLHRNIILKFNVGRRLRKLVGWSAVRVVLVLIGATIILVVISVLVVSTLAASSSVSSVSPIISTPTTAASRVKSWSGRSLSKGVNVQHFSSCHLILVLVSVEVEMVSKKDDFLL